MASSKMLDNFLRRKPSKNNNNNRHRHNASPNLICRKHPKHRQSPGVCSVCLRERLSQLCATSSARCPSAVAAASSCGSSSYASSLSSSSAYSSCPSSCASPTHGGRRSSVLKVPFPFSLAKSRSIAVSGAEGERKRRGFWSKLWVWSGSDEKILLHSRTMRENAPNAMVH